MEHEYALAGIRRLIKQEGLRLPYQVTPGAIPGGLDGRIFADDESWEDYQWNPPDYLDYDEPDPQASPKPTFLAIEAAARAADLLDRQAGLKRRFKKACHEKIAAAYHPQAATDPHREWEVRLSGQDTTAADAERARLVARYQQYRQQIDEAVDIVHLAPLDALDPDADSTWAQPQIYLVGRIIHFAPLDALDPDDGST